MEFIGKLGTYKLIETADGHPTLFSSHFNEACHSLDGAKAETLYNFIEGCKLEYLCGKFKEINILEVGFGTGIGFKTTRDYFAKYFPDHTFNFTSLELDPSLVEWSNLGLLKTEKGYIGQNLEVLIGDARVTLSKLKFKNFHAIFQDPFSPKKNPRLWALEWFSEIKKHCHIEAVLSTYSASSSIRKALMEAGWIVEERAGFSSKRSSTRAYLQGAMTEQLIKKLSSPKIKPVRD